MILKKLHLWVGLFFGALFCLSGLSGSVLVFDDELDVYFNSALWYVEPQSDPIQLDKATEVAQSTFPNHALLLVRLPRASNQSLEYWMKGEGQQKVYVNPWTLEVLGHREEHAGFLGFVHDLHVHFLAGDWGETANGVMGLFLMLMVLTGLWIAWPGWKRFLKAIQVPYRKSRYARWFALHRAVGLCSVLLLFLSALTGATMVFHAQVNPALIRIFGGPGLSDPPVINIPTIQLKPKSPEQLIEIAELSMPGAEATWMRFSIQPTIPFVVRFKYPNDAHPNGTSYVAIAPSGEVEMVHDAASSGTGQQIADYKYPVHIGTVLGVPGRIIVFLMGLVPLILFVTGIYTWWRRRKKMQAANRRMSSVSSLAASL